MSIPSCSTNASSDGVSGELGAAGGLGAIIDPILALSVLLIIGCEFRSS